MNRMNSVENLYCTVPAVAAATIEFYGNANSALCRVASLPIAFAINADGTCEYKRATGATNDVRIARRVARSKKSKERARFRRFRKTTRFGANEKIRHEIISFNAVLCYESTLLHLIIHL